MSTRKNAFYNIAYRVFSIFLPLVTAPYLSRVVGKAGVGLYSYAWSVSEIFVIIGMLGLADYGVRAIAKARDDRARLDRTFSGIFIMQLAVAFITLLVWLGYVAFAAGEEKTIALHLTWMSVSCMVNLDWCLQGLGEFRSIALRNTAVKLLAAGSVFLFVRSADDLWIYGLVWSLATLAGCLLCWPSLKGRVSFVRVPLKEAFRHFLPCSVLLISVLAVRVYRTMDKIMVGALAGMAENGLYENAEKIIYCLSGFISAIGTVLMPKVSHMQEKGETEAIRRHIDVSMQLMMCMTAAMAFGVMAVAPEFSVLFYGDAFAASGTLMRFLAITLVMIGFANVVRTQWILPQARDGIVIRCVTAGAAVNLAVNFLLIPRMGAMGAVIGTLAAELTVPAAQFVILRRELNYPRLIKHAAAYCSIGAVMALFVRLVMSMLSGHGWLTVAAGAVSGAAVFGLLCLAYWRVTRNGDLMGLIRHRKRV
ncbi:MAG: flippase [Clostridia bacterium]|nr:flippase [Clostridia bacterium]